MKLAALVSIFIMFSSYAMEPDITQITISSTRSFKNFLKDNGIQIPYRICFTGGIIMKRHADKQGDLIAKRLSKRLNHAIHAEDAPVLGIYVCMQDGKQKAYLGNLYRFLQRDKSLTKTPITSAVAIIQSKTRTFNGLPEEYSTLESLFDQVATLLDVESLKKYWIKSSQNQQILSIFLEEPNQKSYMMLEDGQKINFHTIPQAKFDAKL